MAEEQIGIRITAKDDTNSAFQSAASALSKYGLSIAAVAIALPVIGSVAKAVLDQIKALTEGVIENGVALDRAAMRFNVPIEKAVAYSKAAQVLGTDLDGVTRAMTMMQVRLSGAMGGEKANQALRDLRIDVEQFKALQPAVQFEELARSISALEDPTARVRAITMLFGRYAAQELIPVLANTRFSFAQLVAEYQSKGTAWSESVAEDAELARKGALDVKFAWEGLKTQAGITFLPMVEQIDKWAASALAAFNAVAKAARETTLSLPGRAGMYAGARPGPGRQEDPKRVESDLLTLAEYTEKYGKEVTHTREEWDRLKAEMSYDEWLKSQQHEVKRTSEEWAEWTAKIKGAYDAAAQLRGARPEAPVAPAAKGAPYGKLTDMIPVPDVEEYRQSFGEIYREAGNLAVGLGRIGVVMMREYGAHAKAMMSDFGKYVKWTTDSFVNAWAQAVSEGRKWADVFQEILRQLAAYTLSVLVKLVGRAAISLVLSTIGRLVLPHLDVGGQDAGQILSGAEDLPTVVGTYKAPRVNVAPAAPTRIFNIRVNAGFATRSEGVQVARVLMGYMAEAGA